MAGRFELRRLHHIFNVSRKVFSGSRCIKADSQRNVFQVQKCRPYSSIYEPEYLEDMRPPIPVYDLLDVKLTGYDFPVLESYAKYVHNTAERVGLDVDDSWAAPCKKFKVTKLKPESTVVETEYQLNLYERNVQISDVPSTLLPIFVDIIGSSIPAGVTMKVHPHLYEYAEIRYVPDLRLKELRAQLDTMKSDREKEREKK